MQRIVDRSEAKAERKRCPQMVAIYTKLNLKVNICGVDFSFCLS